MTAFHDTNKNNGYIILYSLSYFDRGRFFRTWCMTMTDV